MGNLSLPDPSKDRPRPPRGPQYQLERNARIFDLRQAGFTYAEIAEHAGLSVSRVYQIERAERLRRFERGNGQ